MAKKKLLLNEGTTRQFMKYANIKPTYVSNFLNEAEEAEEEMDMEMDEEPAGEAEPEMDAGMEVEDEMEMDMEEPAEEGGDAEAMVMDLLGAIKDWAQSQGVSMELEGDEEEEDMEDEGMEDMEAAPEGGDMGMADDVDADLEAADVDAMDDEEVIAETTRRVARRLLRESAKRR
jgi:hypothetical protein